MAKRSRRKRLPQEPVQATIESLSHDGRGVAHIDGKTTFIVGSLAGEEVMFKYTNRRRSHDEGLVTQVLKASTDRVEANCAHFSVCGGCSLQHMAADKQIHAKEEVLRDNFKRLGGGVEPDEWLEPLKGPSWGYRRKARLGVRYVHKKGKVLVGFRERSGGWVAELDRCVVLHPSVGERLVELGELIHSLEAKRRIAQIEVAVGDNATCLVFRNLDPLEEGDLDKLQAYGKDTGLWIQLQPGGPDSITPLWPEQGELSYSLAEFGVEYGFGPTDFTQVNAGINGPMIQRALGLLDPNENDRVLDLFCGLGNFSLPLAQKSSHVVGVEGDAELVRRAADNARRNGIDNTTFFAADLFEDFNTAEWAKGSFDKMLIDPARTGAIEVVNEIDKIAPKRIVYVSCHPGTLARDAGVLVGEKGYRLLKAGVMDMFPHTAHVESIALFELA